MSKKNRNMDEWRNIIADQESSGKTVVQYCSDNGISECMFYKKRKSIRDTSSSSFVPVVFDRVELSTNDLKLTVDGHRIECSDDDFKRIVRIIW